MRKFLSVVGDVRVISRDGAPRAAQREAEFREGESIITARARSPSCACSTAR